MPDTLYTDTFNKALDLYFENKFSEALVLFRSLLETENLDDTQTAQLLRRIADCRMNLGESSSLLELYDAALALVSDEKEKVWFLASKAFALAHFEQYAEAIELYKKIVPLINDPYDLEHIELQLDDVLEKYKIFQKFGSIDEWKKKILAKTQSVEEELDKESFELLTENKNKLEA